MPKNPNESFQDYMKRVADPISPSFCAAKWLNATIWLSNGMTASCHHPPAHKISVEEIEKNPSALHNTQVKKAVRAQMLKGERPHECDYCWRIEDMGRGAVSDRPFKTVIYEDADIAQIAAQSPDVDVVPQTLEIAFDRTCNFACSYCNASFSTTWAKDIKTNGAYTNLVSDGAASYRHDGQWGVVSERNEDNPYIAAFWRWWPELSQHLTQLRITGGEPLMSTDVWKLLDLFAETESPIKLAINTNLGAKDDIIDRLVEKSQRIRSLDIYTSCEAIGAQAEYIRDGLEWEKWVRNCRRMMTEANVNRFHMMMTINAVGLFSITEFFDLMLEWRSEFGRRSPTMSLNILRFPSFMNPLVLPNHLKDERREHLRAWLDAHKDDERLKEMERSGIARLIDYLEVVNDPSRSASPVVTRHRDFRTFYEQYDKRRGKNFREVFPAPLVEWFDSLPVTNLDAMTHADFAAMQSEGWNTGGQRPKLAP